MSKNGDMSRIQRPMGCQGQEEGGAWAVLQVSGLGNWMDGAVLSRYKK